VTGLKVHPHPALEFDGDGVPLSGVYGDVFRSRSGALAESEQVFVHATALAERWKGARSFTVLEVGFGLGVNFLATLAAWRLDAHRPAALHFVSIEKHPLTADDLWRAHQALGLTGYDSETLHRGWPPATPDLHRLDFEGGRVTLWLALGDAGEWLPQLRLAADAVYLDGFAPDRNPDSWSPEVLRGVARLCRRGARLATYSAARSVRDALSEAGFDVQLRPGFGRKRERIDAVYAPRWVSWPEPAGPPERPVRHALIIGGGLGGLAIAHRLHELGWSITLIEAEAQIMHGGSAQPVCADHLHVSSDDNLTARATRAALYLALSARQRLHPDTLSAPIGRLQWACAPEEAARMRHTVQALGFPKTVLDWVEGSAAADLTGRPVAAGGLWMPGCDALDPTEQGNARRALMGDSLKLITGRRVERLSRHDALWQAFDAQGLRIAEAPVAILCNAGDVRRLGGLDSIELRRIRGQTSWLDPHPCPGLRCILGGPSYAVPRGQRLLIGASFEESDDPHPDLNADLGNLRRLTRMLGLDPLDWQGGLSTAAVGFRWTSVDRLPLIGRVPDGSVARAERESLLRESKRSVPRQPDLFCAAGFGSRGTLWSELAAEWIASTLEGAPLPVAGTIDAAIDPGRRVRHALRRGSVPSHGVH
jgi:tRNA 5-methylaminomethyl-2-thiouridine biosynthesis bifunctional protein